MSEQKKCTGCKETKPLEGFYKNKLILDGHSNYCIECTRENSKKYHQRKKERLLKEQSTQMVQNRLMLDFSVDSETKNADNLMKLLMIEKLCKSIMGEVDSLKVAMMTSATEEVEMK